MSNNVAAERPDGDLPISAERVQMALRFGWTMAEVYGRLRRPLLWKRTAPETPRLFVSGFSPTSGERLWVATRRLLLLWQALFQREEQASDDEGLPEMLVELLDQMEDLIREEPTELPPVEDVFEELNHWSRECWARLDAEASVLAEAVTLGASLADTFWHMRPPRKGEAPSRKETWRYLLGPQRLTALIRSVRRVEPYLTEGTGRMLRHSLWEWSVARELTYSQSGEVKIACPQLYALRSVYLLRRLRRWWMEKQGLRLLELHLDDEKELWRQLQKQMLVWERLIFGRSVEQLLRPSDWRQVRWMARLLYAFAAVFFVMVGAAFFLGLLWVGRFVVALLLPFLVPPTRFEEWLALGGSAVAVLGFVVTQLRTGVRRLHDLYGSIYEWVLACKLDQRSLQAWNGRTKPLWLIGLQRLLRAEEQ